MVEKALALVKSRLNRLDTDLDAYLTQRIKSAISELESRTASIMSADNDVDLMLVVDLAVWQYQNRDMDGAQPKWLEFRIHQRWHTGDRGE